MLSGYYTIASGIKTREKEIETIGNNLINANTPGYKSERVVATSFEKELLVRKERNRDNNMGVPAMATGVVVGEKMTSYDSGLLKSTEGAMDLAIQGEGYFNISGERGQTFLTRNGKFDIDSEGYLVLPGAGRVVGDNGMDIKVTNSEFTIEDNGTILAKDGKNLGKLMISQPAAGTELNMTGDGLYNKPNGTQNLNEGYSIKRGFLELANIDMNQEMTSLIEAQRGFQSCSAALQIVDGINRKAASELGSL